MSDRLHLVKNATKCPNVLGKCVENYLNSLRWSYLKFSSRHVQLIYSESTRMVRVMVWTVKVETMDHRAIATDGNLTFSIATVNRIESRWKLNSF